MRLIDADELGYECKISPSGYLYVTDEDIINATTIDAEPVVHGHWTLFKPRRTGRNATYKCSVCGKLRSSYYNDVQNWKYCPCGAKMDKEEQ